MIATGFDHGREPRGPSGRARPTRARASATATSTMDDRQRSSLEIRDDEIDIPPFLKDR